MNKNFFHKFFARILSTGILSISFIVIACGEESTSMPPLEISSSSVAESSCSEALSSSREQSSSSSAHSSSVESSSSLESSSSVETAWDYLNPGLTYGELVDSRDNKIYKTIKLGPYNFMAENLNYDLGDTANTWCAQENCDLYGRLYTFAAAMDSVKSGCGYGKTCKITDNFKGICPEGWHVLENEEASLFYKYGHNLFRSGRFFSWSDSIDVNIYGFTLLPSGMYYQYSNGEKGLSTKNAFFWTTHEDSDSTAMAYCSVYGSRSDVDYESKGHGLSVRCVENYEHIHGPVEPSSVKKGEFTDARDGQVYKTVTIGKQTWMAENLNYADSVKTPVLKGRSASVETDDAELKKTYGMLYSWAAAMDSGSFDYSFLDKHFSQELVRGICPEGWHLPIILEFEELLNAIGGWDKVHALKAKVGWSNPGDDEYGFSLVAAGRYDEKDEAIGANHNSVVNETAYLWTADPVYETNKSFRNLRAYVYVLDESHVVYSEVMEKIESYKRVYNAVRCIKNVAE